MISVSKYLSICAEDISLLNFTYGEGLKSGVKMQNATVL